MLGDRTLHDRDPLRRPAPRTALPATFAALKPDRFGAVVFALALAPTLPFVCHFSPPTNQPPSVYIHWMDVGDIMHARCYQIDPSIIALQTRRCM